MLNYEGERAEKKIFKPTKSDAFTEIFKPPVEDFAVAKIQVAFKFFIYIYYHNIINRMLFFFFQVPSSEKKYQIKNTKYGSILIVLSGIATAEFTKASPLELKRGSVILVPAFSETIELTLGDSAEDFIAYQAMYNNLQSKEMWHSQILFLEPKRNIKVRDNSEITLKRGIMLLKIQTI